MDFILPILLSSTIHFHFDTNQLEIPADLQSTNIVQLYTDSAIQNPHLGLMRRLARGVPRHHFHRIHHHKHKAHRKHKSTVKEHGDVGDGFLGFGAIFGVLYFMFKN